MRDATATQPRAVTSRRQVALLFSILLPLLLVFGSLYIHRTSFVVNGQRVFSLWDDAMISMEYARNLSEGHGLVWNAGGERVWGFTNLGVTLTMALLHVLPLNEFEISLAFQILNLAILGCILALVWRVADTAFPREPWIPLGATVSVALCAPLSIWCAQGSDAGFVALWLLLCAGPILRAERDGTRWTVGTFVGLAAGVVIRPDALVFAVPLWLVGLFSRPREWRRHLTLGALTMASVSGALIAFGWLYYGDPLPNTYYLKATGAPLAAILTTGLSQLGAWIPRMAIAMILAWMAIRSDRNRPALLLFALPLVAGLAYHVAVGGDWMSRYGSRFAVPALPLFWILPSAGVWRLLGRTSLTSAMKPAAFIGAMLAISLLSNPAGTTREWFDPSQSTMLAKANAKNFRYASYFRDHTHPSTTLALHWAGIPKYFSHRYAIDVLGRSDAHIARTQMHPGRFRPGHSKWDWDYIVNVRKPDIVIGESRGLRERGDFREAYYLVRGPRKGFYLRKTALGKLLDDDVAFEDLQTGRRMASPLDPNRALPQDTRASDREKP